jgi:transcriptional regulator with XRE-family HTH domain
VTIAKAVRTARQARGWSQLELALAAGTTQGRIWAIEAGVTVPGASVIARLAAALGLELQFGPYSVDGVVPTRLAS